LIRAKKFLWGRSQKGGGGGNTVGWRKKGTTGGVNLWVNYWGGLLYLMVLVDVKTGELGSIVTHRIVKLKGDPQDHWTSKVSGTFTKAHTDGQKKMGEGNLTKKKGLSA